MKHWLATLALVSSFSAVEAADLKLNDPAPTFTLKNQDGKDFDLKSRAGQWTVLYFYPKAETPGCTKQACAFRDNIKKIRAQGAEVVLAPHRGGGHSGLTTDRDAKMALVVKARRRGDLRQTRRTLGQHL